MPTSVTLRITLPIPVAAVRAAIAALPARQRMVVVLSRFEGLSYEGIAGVLDFLS